jgi:hypothetical protein
MDVEESGRMPTLRYIVPVFVCKGFGKLRKTAIKVAVVWAEI